MPPTVEVQLPSPLWPRLHLALRNLAIWLQTDLRVRPERETRESVAFRAGGEQIELPVPQLEAWEQGRIDLFPWRGIELPQPKGVDGRAPDLLGLLDYLFNNGEELCQERCFPGRRYDVRRSAFAPIHTACFLDRALHETFEVLLTPRRRPTGLILTHDLDALSQRGLRSHPWSPREALRFSLLSLRKGNLREALFYLASFYELTKVDPGKPSPFEFLDWAEVEAEQGVRSVFFVFAPDRKRTFRDDAAYTFTQRNRKAPHATLRKALLELVERGFQVQPHLSRSSDYRIEEIRREFNSLSRELGVPISATRNHWLWMQYSNWYEILLELGVDFDFNQAIVGYPKGTAMPYWSTNHRTMVFPTTFMDDAVFKKDRLGLSESQGLELLSSQLDNLERFGGCVALSFHPAEDSSRETGGKLGKLRFYRQALELVRRRGVPVYLPEQARNVFERQVVVCNEGGV